MPVRLLGALVCVAAVASACASPSYEAAGSSSTKAGAASAASGRPSEGPGPAARPVPSAPPSAPPRTYEQSDKGAEAFIRHFYAVLDYGTAGRDWKPLKSMSLDSCSSCQNYWRPRSGRFVSGGHPKPGRIIVEFDKDPDSATAEVPLELTAGEWIARPGAKTTSHVPAKKYTFRFELQWKEDQWKVVDIYLIDSQDG